MHSWAFQKFIEKHFKCRSEIIDYTTPQLENRNLKYPVIRWLKKGRIGKLIPELIKMKAFAKRYDKFKDFISRELNVSSIKYTQKSLNSATLSYDVVICESDVIWSAEFFKGRFDKAFFCQLDGMKSLGKVIYAASMANANLNDRQVDILQEYLKGLKYISCRESYAVKKVSKYTEQMVHHVLDPVLLLDYSDYERIISPRMVNDKYLLIYLPVGSNNNVIDSAHEYAKEHNLKVIEISSSLSSVYKHKVIMDAGIEEWFSLIFYADVIFTDSFHAVCFSMIFHKEFYAFSRRTGKKIEDVCSQFGLSNRYFEEGFQEQQPIDFSIIDDRLEAKREYSIKFLENALREYV